MKVICFEPHYNEKHQEVLRALASSIPGAEVRDLRDYEPCDVAVIFGSYKQAYPPTWPKREILQRHQGRRLLMVESAFVKRGEYWQIGWGGYAGNADFNLRGDETMDRWESFGVRTKHWFQRPEGPVVVCGQLPRDTQVQDVDHIGWCRETVDKLLARGYRVLFRPHPREKDPSVYGVPEWAYTPRGPEYLWDTGKFGKTLAEARCVVTWNSTSSVDALIKGVPVIACHPSSIAWSVARHSIDDIEDLAYPSRRPFFAGLGYAQWNLQEIKEGLPWRHLTR